MSTRRIVRAAAVLVASSIVTLLVVEAAYRIVLRARGTPYDSSLRSVEYRENREWLARVQGPLDLANALAMDEDAGAKRRLPQHNLADSYNVLSPYVGVDTAVLAYEQVAQYFRSPEGSRTFDVLILGGSVAGMMHKDGSKALERVLGSDPRLDGRPIRIFNQARGGFKAPQTSLLGSFLLDIGWKPDLVILVDGFNEVALGNANWLGGAHPLYPSLAHWAHLLGESLGEPASVERLVEAELARRSSVRHFDFALRARLSSSAVASRIMGLFLARASARYSAAWRQLESLSTKDELPLAVRGPALPQGVERSMDRIVRAWIESSVSLDAIYKARGIPFIHALQPTLHDEGSKRVTANELRRGKIGDSWLQGVRLGYPRLRAGGEELLQRGVDFIDASMLFADSDAELYLDSCHFAAPGSRALARLIAERCLSRVDLVPAD